MLKFVFWALLCLNGVLLAYGQGYLGSFKNAEREPARLKNQVAPDKLKVITPEQAQAASEQSASAEPSASAAAASASAPAVATIACTEIGPFSAGEAKRFESRLERLDLGERQSRVSVPFQEVTSRLVYIPPLGSKEAAERKAAELRNLGISNFFIISNDSPIRWGISLGLFKADGAAQAMLASLARQGVRSARILPRGPMGTRIAYQFHDIDADTRAKVIGIAEKVGEPQVKACK
jgi:hypothetical protein